MVAGGIGISPFLAILSDILHHINDGKPCLSRNILIVWAIKNSDELPLLDTVDMEAICPLFSDKLNLELQTFVTRESQPPLVIGFAYFHFAHVSSPYLFVLIITSFLHIRRRVKHPKQCNPQSPLASRDAECLVWLVLEILYGLDYMS